MIGFCRRYELQSIYAVAIFLVVVMSCTSPDKIVHLHDLHPAALIDEDQRLLTADEAGAGSFFRSFHPPSDTGRVIHGSEAYFAYNAVSNKPRIMDLALRVPEEGGTVRVLTPGEFIVGEARFRGGNHMLRCRFPEEIIQNGLNHLRINWFPRSGKNDDTNRLIFLRGEIHPFNENSGLSHVVWDTAGTILTMGPGCTYGVFVIPDNNGHITGSVSGHGAGAAITITNDAGRYETLWESRDLDDRRSFRVTLPGWSSLSVVEIRLITKAEGGNVQWTDMQFSGVSDSPFRVDTTSTQKLPHPVPDENRLNVLVYLVDTVRKDRLQIYGYDKPTTPHLKADSGEWLIWDDCQSMSSWTKPSTATLLTGLDPVEHGINAEEDSLKKNVRLIWSEAHDAGYETSCFITNGHIRKKWGFGRDVDHFEYFPPQRWRKGYTLKADSLHDAILSWLDNRREQERPFFCYVHASDPHAPYAPPHEFINDFYPALPETITMVSGQEVNQLNCPAGTFKPWQPFALSALYDAEIAAWEADFTDLLNELAVRDVLEKTIVVLTSDHGEEFADHGMFFHGRTLYNEQLNIPFLMRIPGRSGERFSATMDLGDVGDLLAWIFDGKDVKNWEPPERRGRASLVLWRGFQRARFESGDLAVIWNISPLKACNLDAPEIEVYHSDPGEETSVADDYSVTARACRAALNEWWSRRLEERRTAMELDSDTIEMLKMLGYMSDD